MQVIRSIFMILASSSALLVVSGSVAAQDSVADNIRPVAQVCIAGQPCVGNKAGQSGASDVAPVAAASTQAAAPAAAVAEPAVAAFDAATTYQASCFACHGTGAAGAPELGDKEVWDVRMAKGIDAVMANVVTGLNAMPPKGLCFTCSDDDLRALVDYMVSQ